MNNILSQNLQKCFGCRACEQKCPQNCISMVNNSEGFLYPAIDEKNCINCGLCLKVCPIKNFSFNNTYEKQFYGLKLKDCKKIMDSSSGGVFSAAAEYFLKKDGVVFGAAYDDNLQVHHIAISNQSDLLKLKGSKYVASDTGYTYSYIKQLLNDNNKKNILYSGTPCQIAGLYNYLGQDYDNLFTIDLICHGVPSQKLFNIYINWLNEKYKTKITAYDFRDKTVKGWTCNGKAYASKKTIRVIGGCDPFYSSFLAGKIYRKSCYNCPFANVKNRSGNITIGDFWGVETECPDFYSSKGVSCCIINDKKGNDLFYRLKSNFLCKQVTEDNIVKFNGNLKSPTKMPNDRNIIYENIDNPHKLISLMKPKLLIRIKRYIISIIPRGFIIKLKQILNRR